MTSARPPTIAAALACALVQGCVFLPSTIDVYDPGCQTMQRHMVLQQVQIAEIRECRNQGCTMLVVAGVATAAASVIVSGSVVIVGNVAYWLERKANCEPPPVYSPVVP